MCWLTFFLSLSLLADRAEARVSTGVRSTGRQAVTWFHRVYHGAPSTRDATWQRVSNVHRLGDGLSQTFSPGCWGHCRLQALVYIWASAGKQCSECGVSGEVGGLTDWWTGSVDFWLVGQHDWLVNWVIGWLTGCINGWVGDWEVGLSDQLIDWFGRWSDR